MKNLFIACSGSLLLATNSVLAQSCADVYRNAVRNVTIDTVERTSQSYYFSLYCEKTGETKSYTGSAGFAFPIKGIPIEIEADNNWDENELKEFCEVGANSNYYDAEDINIGSFVVVEALSTFNDCVALESLGLTISHQEAQPNSFIVFGDFKGPLDVTIDAIVYDKDRMLCHSTNFTPDQSAEVVDDTRGYDPEGKDFNIFCTRNQTEQNGTEYYPRTTFQISTSLGPYTTFLPADANLGFNLSSQAQAAYDSAVAERNEARRAERAAVAAGLNRLRTLEAKFFRGYRGDSAAHHSRDVAIGCGDGSATDLENRLAALCGAGYRALPMKHAGSVGGGSCANSFYTMTCLPTE